MNGLAAGDVDARVLEALGNLGGHARAKQLAEATGIEVDGVSRALGRLLEARAVKQRRVWWVLPGGVVPHEPAAGGGPRRRSSRKNGDGDGVRHGIDYARVLEDLRGRRAQLDAAIAAIEVIAG